MAKSQHIGGECVARIVEESTWGTDPGTGQINLPLAAETDMNPGIERELWEQILASSYPHSYSHVAVGRKVQPTWKTPIYPEFKSIIAGCVTRISDAVPSYTIEKAWASSGNTMPAIKLLGCKVSRLTLSSGSEPLVMADMSFIAKDAAAGTNAAMSPSPTQPFLAKMTTCSVGGSSLVGFENLSLEIDNGLITGPVTAEGLIDYLVEGYDSVIVNVTYPISGKGEVTELLADTVANSAIVIVFGNGLAEGGSTLTFTANTCNLVNNPLSGTGGVKDVQKYTLQYKAVGAWTLVAA